MAADLAALENLFLGLADKTRLRLLGLMAAAPVSVGHLVTETGESQPKISRHLAYLRNAGLVETTRDGKWIYYGVKELGDESCDEILQCVLSVISSTRRPADRQRSSGDTKRRPETPTFDIPDSDVYEEHVDEEVDEPWGSTERVDELDIFLL